MEARGISFLGHFFCLLVILWSCSLCQASTGSAERPSRAILFIIDGLHWQAPQRLNLQNFNDLIKSGTYVEKAYLLMPYHPTSGAWAQMHNSSMPNPVMLAGTLFITPDHKLIQESFPPGSTAHAANAFDYDSINRKCNFSMVCRAKDDRAIDFALDILAKEEDIRYLRIHLQNTGTAGFQCGSTTEDVPWRHNIWGEGSPYVTCARQADKLLGEFVQKLKEMGKWNDTLLVVTADHGQANSGWHPLLPEDSWVTPLLFIGPGIAQGRTLPYAEHTDIVPTICDFMGIEPPNKNAATGKVLTEIKIDAPQPQASRRQMIKEIDEVLKEYMVLRAKLILLAANDPCLENVALQAGRRFYDLDRFTDWYKTESLDNLLETNQKVVAQMKQVLQASPAAQKLTRLDHD